MSRLSNALHELAEALGEVKVTKNGATLTLSPADYHAVAGNLGEWAEEVVAFRFETPPKGAPISITVYGIEIGINHGR